MQVHRYYDSVTIDKLYWPYCTPLEKLLIKDDQVSNHLESSFQDRAQRKCFL